MAERGNGRARARTWPTSDGARTSGATARAAGAWPFIANRLRDWARAEAGAGRLLPWVPIAFGAGIAIYFTADREPVAWFVAAVAAGLCAVAFVLRRRKAFAAALMLAAIASGFAVAALKTARISHVVLAQPIYASSLKGFVETHEERTRTDRFVLRVTHMETRRATPTLERVRLSVRKGTAPLVGSFIEMKARLLPPLSPLRPGSYDFGRDMFFQGIGASGFAMGAITTLDPPQSGGWKLRYAAAMQGMSAGGCVRSAARSRASTR